MKVKVMSLDKKKEKTVLLPTTKEDVGHFSKLQKKEYTFMTTCQKNLDPILTIKGTWRL